MSTSLGVVLGIVRACVPGLVFAAMIGVVAATATASATADDLPPEIRAMMRAMPPRVDPASIPPAASGAFIDVGRGPIPVIVPSSYDPKVPTPLIILLHGYTNTGADVEGWMQLAPLAEEYGFLYLYPDGTLDLFGQRFWNATDGCCNFWGSNVDDSGYLLAVIDAMKAEYNVDARRVHFAGHSNGGFMSYRMACDHSETVAAIASLAGATFDNPNDCAPAEPVHQLQIHGTADSVISYTGGRLPFADGPYPGAVETTEQWAAFGGCEIVGEQLPDPLDIDADIPGAETTVTRYATGCDPRGSGELWTIAGGSHSPNLTDDFRRGIVEFLLSHPKPAACPADLDGDGSVGFDDVLALLAAWGPYEPCPPFAPADLDEDCTVGFGDLLVVLAAWGACP